MPKPFALTTPDPTSQIIAIVTSVIKHRIGVPVVTPASTFRELRIDPIDGWSIICAVEEEFGIELSDDEIAAWGSVADVVASVERERVG